MRKALLVALSSTLLGAAMVAPASAQGGASAGGDCAYTADGPGFMSLNPADINNPKVGFGDEAMGAFFARINYANVTPGTTLWTVVTIDDDLDAFVGEVREPISAANGTVTMRLTAGSTNGNTAAPRHGSKGPLGNHGGTRNRTGNPVGSQRSSDRTNGFFTFTAMNDGRVIGKWACAVGDADGA